MPRGLHETLFLPQACTRSIDSIDGGFIRLPSLSISALHCWVHTVGMPSHGYTRLDTIAPPFCSEGLASVNYTATKNKEFAVGRRSGANADTMKADRLEKTIPANLAV